MKESVLEQEQDLTAYEQQLSTISAQGQDLTTITADKLEQAALFIGGCKAAESWIEADRVAKVKPLNDEVRTINDAHNKVKTGFAAARVKVEQAVSAYRTEQKRIADERQRLAIEEANRIERETQERLRLERERLAKLEEEERLAKEQAALDESDIDRKIAKAERELLAHEEAAPENMSERYRQQLLARQQRVIDLRLEKAGLVAAAVDTSKADATREQIAKLEAEAAVPVVAHVVEQVQKTVRAESGTVTFKDDKQDWVLGSWDKKSKVYGNDPLLRNVDKDWLLQHCILDVPRINATFKAGNALPPAFGVVSTFGGSAVRNRKA